MSQINNNNSIKRRHSGGVSDEEDFIGFEDDVGFAGFAEDQLRQPLLKKKIKLDGSSRKSSSGKNKDSSIIRKNYNDPVFRKPFEFKWKRELVIRATVSEKNQKERGDVYYITPSGKRVRTKQEISNYLYESPELTLENFTFSKDPVGGTGDEEVVRHAKPNPHSIKRTPDVFIQAQAEAKGLLQDMGKRIPKKKLPKGASPEPPSMPKANVKTPIAKEVPKQSQNGFDLKQIKTTGKIKSPSSSSKEFPTTRYLDKVSLTKIDYQNPSSPTPQPSSQITAKGIQDSTLNSIIYNTSAFSANFFTNVSAGYDILLHIFQYLKVQELLRCGCVSRMWNQVSNHLILWRTVRMKNSLVTNWRGLANSLQQNNSRHLDLKKMLIASDAQLMWKNFSMSIGTVVNLKSIDFCRCPAWVIENLFISNVNLESLNAVTINSTEIDLSKIGNMLQLQELRLRSTDAITLLSSLDPLASLVNLRHVSLTSIVGLGNAVNVSVFEQIPELESLELGDCSDLTTAFATETLTKLVNLEKLRLEKCEHKCPTNELLDAIATLPKLELLELINFDITNEFEHKISQCTNLRRLLLIPTYMHHSATTNKVVLSGITKLSESLVSVIWVVTTELLNVTELYSEEGRKVKSESIPVLKPLPFDNDGDALELIPQSTVDVPNEIEIIPLITIEKILNRTMPTTKVKILKVPLSSTWKQSMADF